jgi:molybdopterin molybdotransferase
MGTLPKYSDALHSALLAVHPLNRSELVSLHDALRRVLATKIIADRDLPPFHRSQMDGYAVVANEVAAGRTMKVLGHVAAGTSFEMSAEPNECVSIATGAPVPDCFNAVVQHELTDCGTEAVTFHCDEVESGNSIHPKGVDAKKGEVLVASHTTLSPQHLGVAASVGVSEIEVIAKPKVVLLTSGDEVIDVNSTPLPHQIRNGNSAMIAAALTSMGCDVVESNHVQDDAETTVREVERSLDGRCDLLVTVGGISAGKRDFFPEAFANAGVELLVKGANIQPGKPIIVGEHANAIVLGLPGNPVSALTCCCIFGWPIVKGLSGCSTELPWQSAPLTSSVKPNPTRMSFRPCSLLDRKLDIPQWHGSGDLAHMVMTNGLAQLPPSKEKLVSGTEVFYLAYPW